MKTKSFTLNIPQASLDDLQARLANTRWPNSPKGVSWERGVPLEYLKKLADYWRTEFDWRKQEALLNQFPQFTTEIEGQPFHFLHVRSPEAKATPLLLCHGYPGSVVDFLKIIEPLSNPKAHGGSSEDAFHVVAISLPGLGLSPTVTETGWNLMRTTHAFAEIMKRLGYERYALQAGDAGAGIAGLIGAMYSGNIIGIHLNGPDPFPGPSAEELEHFAQSPDSSAKDKIRLERMKKFNLEGSGYIHIQSTRPSTIGYGLHDSPVMQLAWIVEKYKEWTDPDKNLPEEAIDLDQLLTNVSLYWFTGNGAGAAQFLYENMYPAASSGEWSATEGETSWSDSAANDRASWKTPQPVPMGVAVFAADNTIKAFVDRSKTIQHWSEFDKGGHFPAMETPDLLVEDVRKFFHYVRK